MKVLVTGSEGYIGRSLVALLHREGHEVFGVDRLNGYDIRYPEQFEFQAEAVIHLAAMSSVGDCQSDPAACIDVNVLGTAKMIEYAKACGAKRFVFASSGAVYGECKEPATVSTPRSPLSWYGMSKVLAEKLLEREDSLDVVTLRLSNVIGGDPRQGRILPTLMRCLSTGEPFVRRGVGCVRGYVSLDNVAWVFDWALYAAPGTHNVVDTHASVEEVAGAFMTAVDSPVNVIAAERNPWEPQETRFDRSVISTPISDLIEEWVRAERCKA